MAFTEKYVSSAGAGAHDGSSEANAYSWVEAIAALNALGAGGAAGLRYNVKGNVSPSATDTISAGVGGSSTAPFVLRGYTTTPGDAYQGRSLNGTGPLITTTMPLIAYDSTFRFAGASLVNGIVEGFQFTGLVSSVLVQMGTFSGLLRCTVDNSSTNGSASCASANTSSLIADNDFRMSGASGGAQCVSAGGSGTRVIGNRIRGGPTRGLLFSAARANVSGNVIFDCAGVGIDITITTAEGDASFNTIVDCNIGIQVVTATTAMPKLVGNLITDMDTYGIEGADANIALLAYLNRIDRCTTAAYHNSTGWLQQTGYDNVTSVTQAEEYVDAASFDYRLRSTSPARSAGIFGRSMGAISGGGRLLASGAMSGGFHRT